MSDVATAPPKKRRPLVAGSGLLLFVCLFLPTLEVCGDPMAPYEFPFAYHVYVGSALLVAIALVRSLRAARVLYALWYVGWLLTFTAILAVILGELAGEKAGIVLAILAVAESIYLGRVFYRAGYYERAMWIGGIAHGLISLCWYLVLSADPGFVWGVYVGHAGSVALLVSCLFGYSSANGAYREWRKETAQVPPARVVVNA